MTPDPDLTGRFESDLGLGPAPTPPEVALRSGKRARLRRRVALAGAAVALGAVVAGSITIGVRTGEDDRGALDPATSRTPDPTPSTPSTPDDGGAGDALPRAGEDVQLTADGTLLTAPGVVVTRTVPHPYGTVLPDRSVGLEYTTKAGTTVWALVSYAAEDSLHGLQHFRRTSDPAGTAYDDLDDWLLSFSTIDGSLTPDESGTDVESDFVRFAGEVGTRLVARPGVSLLEQRSDLALPAAIAGPDDLTAVAEVRRRGERFFVLARRQPGCPAEYVGVPADYYGDSLTDFVSAPLADQLPIYPRGDEPIEGLR